MGKLKYLRLDITDYQDYLKKITQYNNQSITRYIQNLISKDMEHNKEHYNIIKKMQNTVYSIVGEIEDGDKYLNKLGRPKTKDVKNTCKNINVAVPITLLDKWENIKIVHGSNLTEYITKLIEKDMNANYEHYKNIADDINGLQNDNYINIFDYIPQGCDINRISKNMLTEIYKKIIENIQ